MKIKNFIFLCFCTLITLSQAHAILEGGWGSGGGKAVVCFDSVKIANMVESNDGIISSRYLANITHLETLDLFHAKNVTGESQIHKISGNETYVEFLNRMIEKIQIANPFFAREIIKSKNEFNKRVIGFKHGPVDPTHDENYTHAVLAEQCVLTNIAVQKWDDAVDGHRLFIDMRLFNHIRYSEESKAVLLLHEYLYQVAREKGERDSKSTRDLIGAVLTDRPDVDLGQFIKSFGY